MPCSEQGGAICSDPVGAGLIGRPKAADVTISHSWSRATTRVDSPRLAPFFSLCLRNVANRVSESAMAPRRVALTEKEVGRIAKASQIQRIRIRGCSFGTHNLCKHVIGARKRASEVNTLAHSVKVFAVALFCLPDKRMSLQTCCSNVWTLQRFYSTPACSWLFVLCFNWGVASR